MASQFCNSVRCSNKKQSLEATDKVNCFSCDSSFHLKCATADGYQHGLKNYLWICNECFAGKSVLKKLFESIKTLNVKAETVERRLTDLEDRVPNTCAKDEGCQRRTQSGFAMLPDNAVDDHSAILHQSVKKIELRDRKYNVILYGLNPLDGDDPYELTESLFNALKIPVREIRDVIKLNGPASTLLKVTLYSLRFRDLILRQSKSLRTMTNNFKNVYVNPDLPYEERQKNKIFREKLKEFRREYPDRKKYQIYVHRNEVIMRPPDGSVVTLWRPEHDALQTELGNVNSAPNYPGTPALSRVNLSQRGKSTSSQYTQDFSHQERESIPKPNLN